MRTDQKNILAKILTIIVIAVSVFQSGSLSALAAAATGMSDTMSRNKISVPGVTHSVSMTLPSGTFTGALTLTYANFSAFAGSPTGACATGTVAASATSNVLTLTLTGCTAGTLTVTGFTGTNPVAAGSNTVTLAGAAGITGSFALASVTDDQIGITASVEPSITFNVGAESSTTPCAGTFAGNGGTVALGTLSTAAVTSSDATTSIYHICTRVTTNAVSGAAVTVSSLNAALKSTGTPADVITSATASPLLPGVTGYGMCVGSAGTDIGFDSTVPIGVTPVRASPFDHADCTSALHNIGILTVAPQSVWTLSAPSQNAFARLYIKAGISGTVRPHTDYADTLTFVATGTF